MLPAGGPEAMLIFLPVIANCFDDRKICFKAEFILIFSDMGNHESDCDVFVSIRELYWNEIMTTRINHSLSIQNILISSSINHPDSDYLKFLHNLLV
jgi:hypothetical protein